MMESRGGRFLRFAAAIHLAEAGEGVIFRGETKRELPINRTIG